MLSSKRESGCKLYKKFHFNLTTNRILEKVRYCNKIKLKMSRKGAWIQKLASRYCCNKCDFTKASLLEIG